MKIFVIYSIALLGVLFSVAECLAAHPALELSAEDKLYNKLYPYHVPDCPTTEIRRTVGDHGGQGGHMVAYLRGACPDTSASFPQLKPCDPKDVANPEMDQGATAGISLDGDYKNVKWTWTNGK